jgi:hypothetical protein
LLIHYSIVAATVKIGQGSLGSFARFPFPSATQAL